MFVVYLAVTFAQVWWASRQQTQASARAIVVMGAAQWNGKPSPVLKDRLDHAAALYRAGRAPLIIVTGGKQPGDRVTQGVTGYDYLTASGHPRPRPSSSRTRAPTATRSCRRRPTSCARPGWRPTVLLVSDPYHAYRISQIAGELGLSAHVSPDDEPSSPYQSPARPRRCRSVASSATAASRTSCEHRRWARMRFRDRAPSR